MLNPLAMCAYTNESSLWPDHRVAAVLGFITRSFFYLLPFAKATGHHPRHSSPNVHRGYSLPTLSTGRQAAKGDKIIKPAGGFSLIEALVATAILGVGLMAIVGTFPFSIRANKGSELSSLASSYARTQLETLLTTSYDELNTGTVETRHHLASNPSDPIYTLERETVVNLVDANLNNSATDIGIKKISVTVYWPSRQGASSSLTLTSLLSTK